MDNTTVDIKYINDITFFTDKNMPILVYAKLCDPTLNDVLLNLDMYNVLYYIQQGLILDDVILNIRLSYFQHKIYEKENRLYKACIDHVMTARNDLEERRMIYNENKSDNTLYFTMKKHDPAYRDNYAPEQKGLQSITIKIQGLGDIDIDAGKALQSGEPIKDVTDTDD